MHFGKASVVTRVFGFHRFQERTGAILSSGDVTLPPVEYSTMAFWFDVAPAVKELVGGKGLDFAGGERFQRPFGLKSKRSLASILRSAMH